MEVLLSNTVQVGIVRQPSPEEEELAAKRAECSRLQAELADRELYLFNLRLSIAAFEGKYLRQVGVLYAELDRWNAKIAAQRAVEEGTESAQAAASTAASQADESYAAVHGEAAQAKDFQPSSQLKSSFREAAKRLHPDLATDEADRQTREQYMKRANRAYQEGDEDELKRVLEEYNSSPDSVKGTGIAADLVRVIRQIRQIRNRLTQIELEIAFLLESDIAKLKTKADAAASEGRDLLAEMAANVTKQIDNARHAFEARSAEVANG
jgi:hypothetical protein